MEKTYAPTEKPDNRFSTLQQQSTIRESAESRVSSGPVLHAVSTHRPTATLMNLRNAAGTVDKKSN